MTEGTSLLLKAQATYHLQFLILFNEQHYNIWHFCWLLKMKVVHGAFMNGVMTYGKIIPQITRQTRANVALQTSLTLEKNVTLQHV
jgi:hypothetical protein